MQILETAQSNVEEVEQVKFDCLVCSSGFEERATFLAKTLNLTAKTKIVVCFKNYEDEGSRKKNDAFYRKNNYQFICEDADNASNIVDFLKDLVNESSQDIYLAVDYSSMTRVWYSAILNFFDSLSHPHAVYIYFFYSFSKFSQPINSSVRNIHIGPIQNFSFLSIPDKPTALIIGLGYEKERAFGLTEYFDAETYIFVADKSKGIEYYNAVEQANQDLLNSGKSENIFEYSLNHLDHSESLLYAVCKSLKSDYRLVLAPTGPKPFSLLCILIALRFRDIDVWRISAGHYSKPSKKEPDGTIGIYRVSFRE